MWVESTPKWEVKERRIFSFILWISRQMKVWTILESLSIFCVLLYQITGKPRIPSDNLAPLLYKFCVKFRHGYNRAHGEHLSGRIAHVFNMFFIRVIPAKIRCGNIKSTVKGRYVQYFALKTCFVYRSIKSKCKPMSNRIIYFRRSISRSFLRIGINTMHSIQSLDSVVLKQFKIVYIWYMTVDTHKKDSDRFFSCYSLNIFTDFRICMDIYMILSRRQLCPRFRGYLLYFQNQRLDRYTVSYLKCSTLQNFFAQCTGFESTVKPPTMVTIMSGLGTLF